jgi:hypothetical protein
MSILLNFILTFCCITTFLVFLLIGLLIYINTVVSKNTIVSKPIQNNNVDQFKTYSNFSTEPLDAEYIYMDKVD